MQLNQNKKLTLNEIRIKFLKQINKPMNFLKTPAFW